MDAPVIEGTAQQLAREAADRYFAALAAALPHDIAPGDTNLTAACLAIESAIVADDRRQGIEGPKADYAREAGYLVGVEIGRRLGATR